MFNFMRTAYPILFSTLKADPEWLHQRTIDFLGWLEHTKQQTLSYWIRQQLEQSLCLDDTRLQQNLWGLNFSNPVGLAAGFDKDGVAAGTWSSLGFGFAELGAVTLHTQSGNPRPRLFRLPLDRAALNRMGSNNQGAIAMSTRLQQSWKSHPRTIPISINLCKSKITPLEEAAADYAESFRLLKEWADYFVINVSSPNTPGLRTLQATDQLIPILEALQKENQNNKPILVKISPDLDWEALAAIIDLARTYNVAGIIATNTTCRRDGLKTEILQQTGKLIKDELGGLSGAPLRQRSNEVIRFIWNQTNGQLPIIGVGGIFTPEDAWDKITAGASLIQVYTGWVYEGPWMVRRILDGLLQNLEKQKLSNISEAVGLSSQIALKYTPHGET